MLKSRISKVIRRLLIAVFMIMSVGHLKAATKIRSIFISILALLIISL